MSLLNTGSFLDPLITGVHHFGKIIIGHNIGRHIHADAGNFGSKHSKRLGKEDREKIGKFWNWEIGKLP
jgi:hypothetical protein